MYFPHFSDKIRSAHVIKMATIFSQSFWQSRPLNYFCLVITLIKKTQKV